MVFNNLDFCYKNCCFDDKRLASAAFQPSVMARYAGADYLVSGQLNPMTGYTKLAYYRNVDKTLQTGVVAVVDRQQSHVVARLAFRVLSDTSVFRAAAGTDGLVNCLWEKRLGDRLSMSTSAFLNHGTGDSGLGIGLSFE